LGRKSTVWLSDLGQQVDRERAQLALGVAHGRGGVAVERAEVALPVDQGVAEREGLGHAHQRVVDAGVAVGVVLGHDLADHRGAFAVARGRAAGRGLTNMA
jgi:hypothetical protein